MRAELAAGARAALPLVPAAAAFGASFAVLADAAGFDPVAAVAMSATTFAGSAQFAAVSILGAGGGLAAAVAAALLLNARYTPIGLSIGASFRGSLLRRALESQLIVDESWALAGGGTPRFQRAVLLGAGAALWVGWTGGTVAGAVGGAFLGDPERLGLDGAFPALFVALAAPLLRSRRAVLGAAFGAVIALAVTPVAPAGLPVVAAALGALAGWRR
jgi:predicted branched-subunit amino acid permease